MKRFSLIPLLVVALAANARADDARSAFESGDYAAAVKQLEPQLAMAPPSPQGYYNLALAAEKAGEPTSAALNYERALRLDPGLKPARNARATLAAARQIPLPPRSWTDDVTAVVHPETLVLGGTILAWAGAFGWLLGAQSRGRRRGRTALAVLALVGGAAAIAAGCLADPRLARAKPALVTAKDGAEVLTSPANNSDVIVALPAGSRVGVLSPRGGWTYVDLAGGAKGWVQSDRLTPIVPGEIF